MVGEFKFLPVIKLFRDGPQTACWQYALLNTVPVAASLSMLGVSITFWPYLRCCLMFLKR